MAGNETRPLVLIAGLGTAGSPVAELLARQRPDIRLILLDPDEVQTHNLAKSALYCTSDVGQRKVIAAAHHLRAIAPEVRVLPVGRRLESLGAGPFRIATVAIAALDNRLAKLAWNRVCQAAAVPYALIVELEGGDSLAARLRAFAPEATADRGPCLECGWSREQDYALLSSLSQPCIRPPSAGTKPTALLFSPAVRLAAECCEEIERCLADHPSLMPGEELRILPESRQYMVLRTPARAECLCPHGAPHPQVPLVGAVRTFSVADLICQADAALGRGWCWHAADVTEKRVDDLAPHAERLLADLCPPGDLLRVTDASGETSWLALPTDGLLSWLSDLEEQTR